MDLSNVKPGDKVTIEFEIVKTSDTFTTLRRTDKSNRIIEYYNIDSVIASHEPKAIEIKVGSVVHGKHGHTYKILCVHNEQAWCLTSGAIPLITLFRTTLLTWAKEFGYES